MSGESAAMAARIDDSAAERRREATGARLRVVAMTVGPLLVALGLAAMILLALGVDPLAYYAYVLQRGLISPSGLQATATRMAPLLLIAASLIVAFRAGIWNLGGDGQFLLGAVIVAAVAPPLAGVLPVWAAGPSISGSPDDVFA